MVDIYRVAKRQGIYPPLFTDQMDKKNATSLMATISSETTRHFSLRSQNSEYPRIFQVTETNQNARKLLSTDLIKLILIQIIVCILDSLLDIYSPTPPLKLFVLQTLLDIYKHFDSSLLFCSFSNRSQKQSQTAYFFT